MSEKQHDYQSIPNPNLENLEPTNIIHKYPPPNQDSPVIPIVTDVYPRSQECFSVERTDLPAPAQNIPLPTCYQYPYLAVCPGHYAPVAGHSNRPWDYNMNGGESWSTGVPNIPYEKAGACCNTYNCVCTPARTDPVWSATTNVAHYNSDLPSAAAHKSMVFPKDYTDNIQNTFTNQKIYEKEVENFLKKITSKKDGNIKDSIEPKNKATSSSDSHIKSTQVFKDNKMDHGEVVSGASEPRTSNEKLTGQRKSDSKIDSSELKTKNKKASKERDIKDTITLPKPNKTNKKVSSDRDHNNITTAKEKKKNFCLSLKKKTNSKEEETDKKNKSKQKVVQKNNISKKSIVKKTTVKKIDKIQKQLQLVEEEIQKRRKDLQLKEKEINEELKTKIKYDQFVEEPNIPPPKKPKIMIEENRPVITKYKIDRRPISTIENKNKCNTDAKITKQSIKTNKIKSIVKVPKHKVKTKSKTDKNEVSKEKRVRDQTDKQNSKIDLTPGDNSSPSFKEHSGEINIQYKDHSHSTYYKDLSVMIERGKEEENIVSSENNSFELRIRLFTNPPPPVAQNSDYDVEKSHTETVTNENSSSSDLSFLDDIDVDEIVEILNISGEKYKNNELKVSEPFTLNLTQKEQTFQTEYNNNSNNNLPITEQANKNLLTREQMCTNAYNESAIIQLPSEDVNYDELREILKIVQTPQKLRQDESKSVSDADDICFGDLEADHDIGIFKELEEYRKQNNLTRAESVISDKTLVIDEVDLNDVILIEDDESKNIIEISEDHDEIFTENNTSAIENEIMDEEATQRRVKSFLESIMSTINKPQWLQEDSEISESQENLLLKHKDPKADAAYTNINLTKQVIEQKIDLTNEQDDIEQPKDSVECYESIEAQKRQNKNIPAVETLGFSAAVISEEDLKGNEEHQCDHPNGSDDDQAFELQSTKPEIGKKKSEPICGNDHSVILMNNQDFTFSPDIDERAVSEKSISETETMVQIPVSEIQVCKDLKTSTNEAAGYDSIHHEREPSGQCSIGTMTENSDETLTKEIISKPTVENTIVEMETGDSEIQSNEDNYSKSITTTSNNDELIKETLVEHTIVETVAEELETQSDKDEQYSTETLAASNDEELIKNKSTKPIEDNKNETVTEDSEIFEVENCNNVTITANKDDKKDTFVKPHSENTDDKKVTNVSVIENDNVQIIIKQSIEGNVHNNNHNGLLIPDSGTFDKDKIKDFETSATVVVTENDSKDISKSIHKPVQEFDEGNKKVIPEQQESSNEKVMVKPDDIAEKVQAISDPQSDLEHQALKLVSGSAEIKKIEDVEPIENNTSDKINTVKTVDKGDNLQMNEVAKTNKTDHQPSVSPSCSSGKTEKTLEAKKDTGSKSSQIKMEVAKKPKTKPLQTKQLVKDTEAISPVAIPEPDQNEILANTIEKRLFGYLNKKFSVTELIHNGNYSKVFLCESENETVAAKILRKRRYNDGIVKEDILKEILREHGDGTSIVKLLNGLSVNGRWCFLFQYYPQTLEQALSERELSFHIDTIQLYARQLLTAVLFLRKHGQVHSAIKPGHILINTVQAKLKLCGFDEMCHIDHINKSPYQGEVHYRPPEVILGYRKGFAIDVWSAALIIHEMATNMKLFNVTTNREVLFHQMLNFGSVPPHMRTMSLYRKEYYNGCKFIRHVIMKDFSVRTVYIAKNFVWTYKFGNKVLEAYERDWARANIDQAGARQKIQQMTALLKDMLVMNPDRRICIEFACAHPFIYEYNTPRKPLLSLPY